MDGKVNAMLIDRDDTLAELRQFYCPACDSRNGIMCRTCYMFDALNVVEDMPAVDAEPVRRGEWVLMLEEFSECSECGMIRNIRTQFAWEYCPNCGAKMGRGGRHSDVDDKGRSETPTRAQGIPGKCPDIANKSGIESAEIGRTVRS